MSNEERNDDEMVDETSETGGEETGKDTYNYSGQDVAPKSGGTGSSGKSSAGIWAIIVLVVLALIGVGWYQWSQTQQREAQQALADREQIRQRQLGLITDDVRGAAEALDSGDIDTMIGRLQEADVQLDIIARAANSSGDIEAARQITAKRNAIQQTIKSLDPIYAELEAKREEIQQLENRLKETARSSMQDLSTQFDRVAVENAEADTSADAPAAEANADEADASADAPAAEANADEADASADAPAAGPPADEDVEDVPAEEPMAEEVPEP